MPGNPHNRHKNIAAAQSHVSVERPLIVFLWPLCRPVVPVGMTAIVSGFLFQERLFAFFDFLELALERFAALVNCLFESVGHF